MLLPPTFYIEMKLSIPLQQSVLFLSFAFVYCLLTSLTDQLPLDWAVKILPILLLIAVSVKQYKLNGDNKLKLFIIGLLFCMGGDIFLAVDRENLFVFGLGSFLIGHLFYIAAMLPITKQNLLGLALLSVYGISMMSLLTPNLAELLVPVVIYLLVLLLMAATSMTSKLSNPILIIGGLSFAISDSLIGVDKFYVDIPYAGLWIMITYYLAQYCLTSGFLASYKQK